MNETLADLFVQRGVPEYLRSDNGPEFVARTLREWLARLQVQTLYVEPGSPWENGYIESFNGKLRDELLNLEIFDTLYEAQVLVEHWRVEYNTRRPHSSLGYRSPAPEGVRAVFSELRGCAPAPAKNGLDPNLESGTTWGGRSVQRGVFEFEHSDTRRVLFAPRAGFVAFPTQRFGFRVDFYTANWHMGARIGAVYRFN